MRILVALVLFGLVLAFWPRRRESPAAHHEREDGLL